MGDTFRFSAGVDAVEKSVRNSFRSHVLAVIAMPTLHPEQKFPYFQGNGSGGGT
ncbi:hypothetical protein WNZ15_23735 [Roseibium sp. AS2]|uniref:hypothetical protein n=1 Tax=Roseibium sp. AS2 TaxID=3135781 RepID=UPI003170EA65